MERIAGYCALCRAKELEMYGTILNNAGPRHAAAAQAAGCGHPASYGRGEVAEIIRPGDNHAHQVGCKNSTP